MIADDRLVAFRIEILSGGVFHCSLEILVVRGSLSDEINDNFLWQRATVKNLSHHVAGFIDRALHGSGRGIVVVFELLRPTGHILIYNRQRWWADIEVVGAGSGDTF